MQGKSHFVYGATNNISSGILAKTIIFFFFRMLTKSENFNFEKKKKQFLVVS